MSAIEDLGTEALTLHLLAPDMPELWFSDEMLLTVLHNQHEGKIFATMSVTRALDHIGLNHAHHTEWCQFPAPPCFIGAIVKIGTGLPGRERIYKITEYDMCKNQWLGKWPD